MANESVRGADGTNKKSGSSAPLTPAEKKVERRLLSQLADAIASADPESVRTALAAGASALLVAPKNAISDTGVGGFLMEGLTPLIFATYLGLEEIVEILLPASAVNARDNHLNATALMRAASGGKANLVRMLLKAGADPVLSDKMGRTALMEAAANAAFECVQILLPLSDPNAVNKNGENALMIACYEAEEKHAQTVAALLDATANLDTGDAKGETALIKAIRGRSTPAVYRQLFGRVDPDALDQSGFTALMWAVFFAVHHATRDLAAVSDLSKPGAKGRTAFDLAVRHKAWEAADLLSLGSPRKAVQKAFKNAGETNMPRWAALIEAEQLAKIVVKKAPFHQKGSEKESENESTVKRRPKSL